MSTRKPKGVSRIDHKHTHGWLARLYLVSGTLSRMFSDGNGGKDRSLARAESWHKSQERSLFLKLVRSQPGFRLKEKPIRSNSSGVTGVSETFHRSKSGRKLPCFCVTWPRRSGVNASKKFSILRYGRPKAFKMAVEFRHEMVADLKKTDAKQIVKDWNAIRFGASAVRKTNKSLSAV